ncbi:MAG: hypothetical protein Q8916_06105 [Bacteroidota bacterium]|nr:hypothetical protein [Bacteroidota bacterium]MDP4229962.1 hypothetical protein [Bacteroidota bacterium]MDP4235669.1 hypothetical protein [Bacteroidota bacterium]
MNTLRPLLLILSILLISEENSSAQAHDSLDLRLNLKKGDRYELTSSQKGTDFIENEDGKLKILQQTDSRFLVTVEDTLKNEVTRLAYKLESISITMSGKNLDIHVETDDFSKCHSTTQATKKIVADMYALATVSIGRTFWVDMNKRGEAIRTDVDSIYPEKDDMTQMIRGSAKQCIQTTSFAGYPVAVGDRWKGIGYLNQDGKVVSTKSIFTLKSLDKQFAKISSENKGWGDVTNASVTSDISADFVVDIPTGLAIETHYIATIDAKREKSPYSIISEMTVKLVKQ